MPTEDLKPTRPDANCPQDSVGEEPLDPIRYRAHLYQALNRLWWFPSLGAFWILGSSVAGSSLRETLISSRIENIAALLLLLCHFIFFLQSRRFHQLNQSQGRAKFRS